MKACYNKLNEGEKKIPKESKEVKLIEEEMGVKDKSFANDRKKSNVSGENEKQEEDVKVSRLKNLCKRPT